MGKVVATYLVKVTLRKRDDLPPPDEAPPATFSSEHEPEVPTNERMAELVERALYDDLAYFTAETIHATSERTDR